MVALLVTRPWRAAGHHRGWSGGRRDSRRRPALLPGAGPETGGAAAFFAIMLGLAVLPLVEFLYPPRASVSVVESGHGFYSTVDAAGVPGPGRARRWAALPGCVAGVLVVAFVGLGLRADRFDAVHPAPAQLMYALDTDSGQASWVSTETKPGDWTRQYVTRTEDLSSPFPVLGTSKLSTGPARMRLATGPQSWSSPTSPPATSAPLVLSVRSQRPARLVYLRVDSRGEGGGGQRRRPPGPDRRGEHRTLLLLFHAPPTEGLKVRLTLSGTAQPRSGDGRERWTHQPTGLRAPAGRRRREGLALLGAGARGEDVFNLTVHCGPYDAWWMR